MVPKDNGPAWIDAYVASLVPPFADAIKHIRQVVREAAPQADEIVTYAMPGLGWKGPLISYFAFKKHCSFFPMGNSVFVGMEAEIAPWRTSTGTLQFSPHALPPDELLIRMVHARLAENAEKEIQRAQKRRRPKVEKQPAGSS